MLSTVLMRIHNAADIRAVSNMHNVTLKCLLVV
ncbi:hypothetical protein KUCAC02_014995 [Chaenocephalus aceratus]|nr:hypothetical protein KUCAC02_014995 [Chaenocephalus aceratus]